MEEAMIKNKQPIICTPRLRLRPFREKDGNAAVEILTDQEVGQTYMVPDFASRMEAQKLFLRLLQLSLAEDRFVYGVYLEDTLIGWINEVDKSDAQIELGYVIHPRWKNRGFGTEALTAAIQALFAMGYVTVLAGAFEENTASIRVMEKSGMTLTAREEVLVYRGTRHRCVYYAATADAG
jgi:RimJ/RimL family protein N-acetyltransferase